MPEADEPGATTPPPDRREWTVGDGVAKRWQDEADVLANRSIAAGDPTGWFDVLYRSAGTGAVEMPWDRDEPNPVLVDWARSSGAVSSRSTPSRATSDQADTSRADTGRAIVVGGGLGMDAEFVSGLGYDTTAFDVSPTAVATARARHPRSTVDYVVANLLDPPAEWARAFDLVVEIYTVQAMPRSVRTIATANVANLVAPGGTLVVVQGIPPTDDINAHGPPWLLIRREFEAFAASTADGESLETIDIQAVDAPTGRRWRAEFYRPR